MTQLYWNIWITLRNFDVNDLKTIQWQSFGVFYFAKFNTLLIF